MKICLISPYPKFEEGIGAYSKALGEALTRRNMEVFSLPYFKSGPSMLFDLEFAEAWRLYCAIRKRDPDLVHVQFTTAIYPKMAMLCLLPLVRTLGKPVVLTQHEVLTETRKANMRVIYERAIYGKTDSLIVHTEFAKRYLQGLRIPDGKISVIPHGIPQVPSIKKAEARRRLGLNKEDRVLLIFGYISPHKGIERAIEAMPLLIKNDERTKLFVVGGTHPLSRDASYLERLVNLSRSKGLGERVTFTGYVEEPLVTFYLRAADALLLPYQKITESGVLRMAIGAELPVIAPKIGGLEVVEIRGIGVQMPASCDAVRISQAVEELLGDTERYGKSKSSCRELASKQSWERVAEHHVNLYKRLIA